MTNLNEFTLRSGETIRIGSKVRTNPIGRPNKTFETVREILDVEGQPGPIVITSRLREYGLHHSNIVEVK